MSGRKKPMAKVKLKDLQKSWRTTTLDKTLKKTNKEKHQSDSLRAKYKIESDSILLHSTVHTM